MNEAAFLARFRPQPQAPQRWVATALQAPTELRAGEDPLERFCHELVAAEGSYQHVDEAGLGPAVSAFLETRGARRVALSDDLAAYRAPLSAALHAAGVDAYAYRDAARDRRVLASLDATITGCAGLVAATGSIITTASAGRAAALIAPIHITIAREDQLIPGLAAAFGRAHDGSYRALQSGPSRTADIEKTLILGMHGPAVTHVILLGAASTPHADDGLAPPQPPVPHRPA